MTDAEIKQTQTGWASLADTLYVPHTVDQYEKLGSHLDELIDQVGEAEDHLLASLMEVIGVLIEKYEDEHVPELKA